MTGADGAFELRSLAVLEESLRRLEAEFASLPPGGSPSVDLARLKSVLGEVADRLGDNLPYFHPLYAGQMSKPPHPVARLAYALSLWINPNNHSLDGGRASSAMEKDVVAELAKAFGWTTHLGHLTGGGTMANLEALWVAGQLHPGKLVVASEQAHYTHRRISSVLGLRFEACRCDTLGRLDLDALRVILAREPVGTVIATMGTTALGTVDPLPQLLELQRHHGFRLHADAAYGGYFTLADNLRPETRTAFDALNAVDSLVIDPHKHGLQPYGCGCVLFRDPSVGKLYRHDSPYTYFSSAEMHLGEISLECSRPGAAAVALWATQRMLPLVRGGEFAAMLSRGRAAALDLFHRIASDRRFVTGLAPELDIVVWIPRAPTASAASAFSRRVFEEAAKRNLHLALAELPLQFVDPAGAGLQPDRPTVTCLRSVLMKPEHEAWIPQIWELLSHATKAAGEDVD
jgi:glutamate/tyrosine decarboxylase-like PLP-dependent enzyme